MQLLLRRFAGVSSDVAAFLRTSSARSAAAAPAGYSVMRTMHSGADAIPSSVDWRKSGVLGPVRMQGCNVMRTMHSGADAIPSSVDWRKSGVLGPVRMQGCNDCWDHASMGSIEAINAIVTGQFVALSRKQLIDCNWKNSVMIGGFSYLAFEYAIRNGGIVPEALYPYDDKLERYRKLTNVPLVTINDYGCVPCYSPDELCKALSRQPVVVSVAVDDYFQLNDKLHLPASLGGDKINHDVLAVAYDDYDWTIMNTWDVTWGEGGFAKIPRSLDHVGGAYRILQKNAYYPIKTCENRYGNVSHECVFSN